MPNADCPACHGMGAIPMTAHFYTGDQEWEAPCWDVLRQHCGLLASETAFNG